MNFLVLVVVLALVVDASASTTRRRTIIWLQRGRAAEIAPCGNIAETRTAQSLERIE
jgi:hypothetical protein